MHAFISAFFTWLACRFRSRAHLELEVIVLHHQLAVLRSHLAQSSLFVRSPSLAGYTTLIVISVAIASCVSVGRSPSQNAALSPAPASSILEVIERLEAIDAAVSEDDGLRWFNYLYLDTTKAVYAESQARDAFVDPEWISRLDVIFANLYFDAVRDADNPDLAPAAWRPLLRDRMRPRIARLQFALAGMNAHINRDLVSALLEVYRQDGVAPNRDSAHHADFIRINKILEDVEKQIKPILLVGTPLENGGHFAPLENLIATWSVKDIRHAAWYNSQVFWRLRNKADIQKDSLSTLDRATELTSSALLAPVLP